MANPEPTLQTPLKEELTALEAQAVQELAQATTLKDLDALRVTYLGRKGKITHLMRGLKDVAAEERPILGALANEINDRLSEQLEARMLALKTQEIEARLQSETIDVTMPGVFRPAGHEHPLTQVTADICEVFEGMGFRVLDDNLCPEVETDHYNFEALNFPPDHPARDMQDTFYTDVASNVLLRSQTSNAQIRFMENNKPPIRVVAPGRVYRNEEVNSRKYVLFHQLEGLLVDEHVRFSDLKGILHEFARHFFGGERPTRFRTSFFPFTEPSAEMDVQCIFCNGSGCRVCGHHGWLEVLGAGMVDPNVLTGVGIDPDQYNGFAFGLGLERLAMLKHGIDDIRLFYTNDLRFLQQFRGDLAC
jgi:phenylalanyl-tRNA synthetase alpha chain